MKLDGVEYKERIRRRDLSFSYRTEKIIKGVYVYNRVYIYSDLIYTNSFVSNDCAISGKVYRERKI